MRLLSLLARRASPAFLAVIFISACGVGNVKFNGGSDEGAGGSTGSSRSGGGSKSGGSGNVGGGQASGGEDGATGGKDNAGGSNSPTGGRVENTGGRDSSDGGSDVGSGGVDAGSGGSNGTGGGRTCPAAPNGVCECEEGDTQSCEKSGAKGACALGTQDCTPDGVYGPCSIQQAAMDDCSVRNDDSDCDGTPNGGCPCVTGDVQSCGPTTDQGICEFGTSTCANLIFGQCMNAVYPAARACDSALDNDCNGQADNTLDTTCKCKPDDTQQCNKHPGQDNVGICRPGNQGCVRLQNGAASDWGTCSGDVGPKTEDCTNNLDDDCDGAVNDGCPCSQSPTPCQHNGVCNPGSGTNYTCNCTGTGYEGTLCDKPRANVVTGPTGASSCVVVGISDTGTAMAAQCEVSTGSKGYFWTSSAGWSATKLESGKTIAYLSGLSSNGTVAAGSMRDSNGTDWCSKWSSLTSTGVTLPSSQWRGCTGMSANGNVVLGIEVNGTIWSWSGTSNPVQYMAESGSSAVLSGTGTVVYTSWGSGGGYQKWSSPTSSTNVALAGPLYPIAVSNDGSVMIGTFSFAADGIYKTGSTLNSTSTCLPLSLSSDGAYVLGRCTSPAGLVRWFNTTASTVQSLLAATGSTYTLPTNQDAKMAYNASWVAVPTGNNGDIAILHIGPN